MICSWQKSFILSCVFLWGHIIVPAVLSGTFIKTDQGLIPIESIAIGDRLIGYNNNQCIDVSITNISTKCINTIVKITTNNGDIYAAPDQLFYDSVGKRWIVAEKITTKTTFLNYHGNCSVCLNTEVISGQSIIAYYVTTTEPHTFFVYDQELLTHNFAPAIFIGVSWAFGGGIEFAGFSIGTAIIGAVLSLDLFKNRDGDKKMKLSIKPNDGGSGGNRNNNDGDDKKDHPFGTYNEAPYHHKNSKGEKSPAPKDGQRCLDHSLSNDKGNSKQRISIEEDKFVILKQTRADDYHGYCVEWDMLHEDLRNVLREYGLVTKAGKIIKEMVKAVLHL